MNRFKRIRNSIFKYMHPGRDCYCLYCNKTYGKFIHEGVKAGVFRENRVAGGGYKTNTRCPNCGSVDRARLLALFFKLRTDVFMRKTDILHISPNKHIANLLCANPSINHLVGALDTGDFCAYNTVTLDVQHIALGDNSFDVVICCHVIEHVESDMDAMQEIYRILRPSGYAIMQVPLALNRQQTLEDKSVKDRLERKRAYGQVDHLRLYGLDYFDKLRNAGFRVIRDNPYENLWCSTKELDRHRLDRLEDVIIAYKD
jgi:SAM-dependent methyltransferase